MQFAGAILLLSLHIASVTSVVLHEADDVISARLTAELHRGRASRRSGLSGHSNSRQNQWDDPNSYPSPTWSGAVAGDGDKKFQSVSANIVVPEATFPYGFQASETYEASAWVGIGGTFTKDTSLIQTGFYYSWSTDGLNKGMYAFYEWYPEPAKWYDVSDIKVGDKLYVKVELNSSRIAGTVTYENLSRNPPESVSLDITAPDGLAADGLSADWIVENWLVNGTNVPNWGTLEFTKIEAILEGGEVADLSDPNIFAWPMNGVPYSDKGNNTIIFPGAIDVKALTASSTWKPWM